MAERTVSVRLTAKTEPYVQAMKQAQGSTADLQRGAGRDFQKLGASMQNIGKKATVGVTLPLVGVGAASVKMASNFDASMSKIVGLVGLSADEVDGMKASVLDLAGSTATAPQELADALFVLTSAGLKGDDALSALEYSAKASAAGLGETEDIARAVSGAMNAYGPGVLDAAHATDVLTATARAGNFETSELASSLGKVLPFAKQAQASFEDVGGAVALLTRTNGNASESVTQIQALMRAFVVPTAEAATALTAVGLSAEDVRDSIGENGLVSTLQMLDGKLGGNREQLGRLLGSSEAASAAFQILDADAQTIADTFGVTNDAVGLTQSAFEAFSSTASGEMKQALVDLGIAMIQVGEVIAPMAASIAGGIGDMAGAFSDLDPALQKVVVLIAGAAAAAGPLLIVTGSLIKNYTLLRTATTNLSGASTLAKGSLAGVGVALTAAVLVYESYNREKQEATQRTESFKAAHDAERAGQEGATEALIANELASTRNREAIEDLGVSASDVARFIMGEQVPAIQKLVDAHGKWGDQAFAVMDAEDDLGLSAKGNAADFLILMGVVDNLTSAYGEATAQDKAKKRTQDELTDATEDGTGATKKATAATDDGTDATDDATDAIKGQISAARIIQGEIDQAASNMRRFGADGVENMRNVDSAADEAAAEINELTAQFQRLRGEISDRSAYLSLEDQFDSVQSAAESAYTAAAEGSEDAEGAARDHEQAVLTLKGQVMDYAEEVGNIPVEQVTDIEALIDQGKLAEARAALADLERSRQVRVDIVQYYSTVGSSRVPVNNRGGPRALGGPTYGGYMHEVNENGSELLTEGGKTYLMAGRDGYVTPLQTAPAAVVASGGVPAAPNFDVNVFVDGKRMISDEVTVQITQHDRALVGAIAAGVR